MPIRNDIRVFSVTLVLLALFWPAALLAQPEPVKQGEPPKVIEAPDKATLLIEQMIAQDGEKTRREISRLRHEVGELRREVLKPDAREIIAGLGFIAGIFGFLFYLRAKSRYLNQGSEKTGSD